LARQSLIIWRCRQQQTPFREVISQTLFISFDVYTKTSTFWNLLDIDAYPLGRFCMPLHGAATTYQGPDTAVHDVSNTAYRLIATKSYRGYDHLAATLRSWAGSMLSHNGPLSAVVLAGLQLRRTKGSGQQSSFTTTSHTLCTALTASRAPLLYNTASPFTMELRKVTMPFKLRSQREGWACCLSRRARQCLGVVGRESRSSFTWNHVNSTLHTRSTTSPGSTHPLSHRAARFLTAFLLRP
jgi:hypothetical protein